MGKLVNLLGAEQPEPVDHDERDGRLGQGERRTEDDQQAPAKEPSVIREFMRQIGIPARIRR